MNVFADTNVLLDVLAQREPFYTDSARIWTLAETGLITGLASSLSLPNLFYILRRGSGRPTAHGAMSILRDIFSLVPLDSQIVNQAIDSGIDDFEDAIQFFSAVRAGADVIVTRNARHYPSADIAIQSPAEFLATHFSK